MDFDTYRKHDGVALAEAIAAGQASAAEVLEVAIKRAEAVNPQLNAIIHPLFERARQRTPSNPAGPLAGVPFLVKDLFQEIGGEPAHSGNVALKQHGRLAPVDQEYVRRIENAGALIFGKTNTPEFGAKGITEPEAYGPTRNPWHLNHTPGGSSGGSAAAVAAGIVPAAGANDGGGSIRIPAACCGLFGFKPGRGQTPSGPPLTDIMHGAAVNGVISRSVRDSAAWLDVLRGPEHGAGFYTQPPEQTYVASATNDPQPLRIGYTTRSPIDTPVHPEAVAAVEATATLLRALGHTVEQAEPQLPGNPGEDFLTIWFAQLAAMVNQTKSLTGHGNNGFELDTRAMAALGHALRADEYVACTNRCQENARALADFHAQFDLLLTPTLAFPPARIGQIATPGWQRAALKALLPLRAARLLLKTGIVDQMTRENLRWVPFTQLANLTGVPAMSVPLHWTQENLPLGVQFTGPTNSEPQMISLAGQLERTQPWFHKTPEL